MVLRPLHALGIPVKLQACFGQYAQQPGSTSLDMLMVPVNLATG
jgi:hypothetical protein